MTPNLIRACLDMLQWQAASDWVWIGHLAPMKPSDPPRVIPQCRYLHWHLTESQSAMFSAFQEAHKLCHNNRGMTGECGCFYCEEIFDASEITEWIDKDQTAICPKCGIDSVIPNGSGRTDPTFLKGMNIYYFSVNLSEPRKR